jgi:hypothetical protein
MLALQILPADRLNEEEGERHRMRTNSQDRHGIRQTRWADQVFAILLRLYPRAHRRAFGQQMLQTFHDHYRDMVETRRDGALWYWHDVLRDTGRSLVREYLLALRTASSERTGPMKTGVWIVMAVAAGLLLLLGLRVWLSPAVLSAPHGAGTGLSTVVGLALLLLAYALVAGGLFRRAPLGTSGPRPTRVTVALRRATLVGALLGGGALVAIAVDTLGNVDSSLSLMVWGVVLLAAPLGWGVASLRVARAGGSWRLGLLAGLWSGMVSALVGTAGEVASTLVALPRLVQHELSNPDYLAWHQPDVQSYAIASALSVAMIGLILAPIVASIAGSIGSGLGKSGSPVALPDQATSH